MKMNSCRNEASDTIADPTLLAMHQRLDIDHLLRNKSPNVGLVLSLSLIIDQQLHIPF
jgi:hypothetical protein